MNHLIVYGTLRPGTSEPVTIQGEMRSLGWFPGVRLGTDYGGDGGENAFKGELISVDDNQLANLDRYEGYYKDDPDSSLYIRKIIIFQDKPVYIYEYNHVFSHRHDIVPEGDWLKFRNEPKRSRFISEGTISK